MKRMKVNRSFQILLLVIWLAFTCLAFVFFTVERLIPFDANQKLLNVGVDAFESHVLEGLTDDYRNSVIHFSKTNCQCNKASAQHISSLDRVAGQAGFKTKTVIIEQHKYIPAAPSVAIVDKAGELVYFGPYGEGLGCNDVEGYAQTVLNNYLKGFESSFIVSDAKGCYCQV